MIDRIIDIIAGAAAGDVICYIIFCCLAGISYLAAVSVVKFLGLPKLIALAWALDEIDEDDTYPKEEE